MIFNMKKKEGKYNVECVNNVFLKTWVYKRFVRMCGGGGCSATETERRWSNC